MSRMGKVAAGAAALGVLALLVQRGNMVADQAARSGTPTILYHDADGRLVFSRELKEGEDAVVIIDELLSGKSANLPPGGRLTVANVDNWRGPMAPGYRAPPAR